MLVREHYQDMQKFKIVYLLVLLVVTEMGYFVLPRVTH